MLKDKTEFHKDEKDSKHIGVIKQLRFTILMRIRHFLGVERLIIPHTSYFTGIL